MAESRTRRRFLPSIASTSSNATSEETQTALTLSSNRNQITNRRRRGINGFRNLFSTNRFNRNPEETQNSLPTLSNPNLLVLNPDNPSSEVQSNTLIRPYSDPIRSTTKRYISVENNIQSLTEDTSDTSSRVSSAGGSNRSSIDGSSNTESNSHAKVAAKDSVKSQEKSASDEESCVEMYKNSRELKQAFKQAKLQKDYSAILQFLTTTFNSFASLKDVFTASDYEQKSGINTGLVNTTYDVVLAMPCSDHRKAILKSIVNCLLNNIKKKQDDEDLVGYLALLQNPQFDNSSSYVIFSNLLRQISSLSDKQHQILIGWIEWLPVLNFKGMVKRLKEFVSVALFPLSSSSSQNSDKMQFWVPSAVKVLALLNAANWKNNKPIVSYRYMYINELDNIDLPKEYDNWQNRTGTFTFCQYPFLLSLNAKRFLLEKDSETQMIEVARKSLIQGVKKREAPAIGMLFLNIKVRRNNLISDSLNEILRKRLDLKKKLKVTFVGEPGVDMGGLTKEWFMLLVRQIFRPEYGMFRYDDKSSCYWFVNMAVNDLSEYNLVGVLMGLAVYNSTILDIRFPLCCYKKLLSPIVVPTEPNSIVGVTNLALNDLKEVMPDLAKGLQELLTYDGNVEEDLCQTFQVSSTVFGSVVTENLVENGDTIPVTNTNRHDFVNMYVDHILNKSIYRQFAAFYRGFHSVCASNALIMLRPEEVEMLVCGNPDFDMKALSKVTVYDGFSRKDVTIRYFWEIVSQFSSSLKRKFLRFCTGSDRIPVGGMAEMDFKITKIASEEMLPMAHTCFNQLCLPAYKTRQILKTKLTIAISNSEGFGLE